MIASVTDTRAALADAILERIGYQGRTAPDGDTLAGLQRAFLNSVPFENLDIHRGVPIALDTGRILDKIVTRRRGGFCYECNTVMYELLRALGYRVDRVSARMALGPAPGAEFDHMALVVSLEEEYLVDVGNGQSADVPLSLGRAETVVSEGLRYRVGPHGNVKALWLEDAGRWRPRFLFTRQPRRLADYAGMCRHHQRSPESIFTQGKLATRPSARGRITYTDGLLTVKRGTELVEEHAVAARDEPAVLAEHFGIHLD